MFKCKSCNLDYNDGVLCSICLGQFDFSCAGITEIGYRRMGESKRSTWKCSTCKKIVPTSPQPPIVVTAAPLADLDTVLKELKKLTLQVAVLPELDASIKAIKMELTSLKSLKPELTDIKNSINFVNGKMEDLTAKITDLEREVQSLLGTKVEVAQLRQRIQGLEVLLQDNEQRQRLNNIEIKGVPVGNSENLFHILEKIGSHISHPIPKDQINYIARVPMRNDKNNKSIVISIHSRYIKDDFVAAAKKYKLTPAHLGLSGTNRIFINEHLTLQNKLLLNKTKDLAKERGYTFTWVKGCKIFVRKNPTSPIILIKSEEDLKKL